MPLTTDPIRQFIDEGFVKLADAFPRSLAEECRAILWKDTGCNPDDPATWTMPVLRLGGYAQEPFVKAANTTALHQAFDQLAGQGRWTPLRGLGTFPVRFPHPDDPGDTGWHIDTSFAIDTTDANDFLDWRVNIRSKGRAMLLLFLFSDVGQHDAPTRIRAGSHLEIARMIAPAGENGITLRDLAKNGFAETADCPEVIATGGAGTVYLCHPFLVHAAQTHRGTQPRFLAQPPLFPAAPYSLDREDGNYSPVEQAIRLAIESGTPHDCRRL